MERKVQISSMLAVLMTIMLRRTDAFSSKKVTLACSTMQPGHIGFGGQSSPAPYAISVKPEDDGSYTVTLSGLGGRKFKGFLLEARNSTDGDERIGNFTPVQKTGRMIACSYPGGAVQHVSSDEKNQVSAKWEPGTYKGPVRFKATVVQSYSTYWKNIFSQKLTV